MISISRLTRSDLVANSIIVLCALAQLLPSALDQNIVQDDIRQHYLPFYKAHYGSIFPNYDVAEYMQDRFSTPLHFVLIYFLAQIIHPEIVSEFLGIVLAIWSGIIACRIARNTFQIPKIITALWMFFLAIALRQAMDFNWVISSSGGFQRSFGMPLTLLFTESILNQNRKRAVIIAIISGLTYPPSTIVMGMYFGVEVVESKVRKLPLPLMSVWGCILSVTSLLLLAMFKSLMSSNGAIGAYVLPDAFYMDEFRALGMLPYFSGNFLNLWGGVAPKFIFSMSIFVFFILFINNPNFSSMQRVLLRLILSGLGSWILAYLFFLRLYEPARYLTISLRIVFHLAALVFLARLYMRAMQSKIASKMVSSILGHSKFIIIVTTLASITIGTYIWKKGTIGSKLNALPPAISDYLKGLDTEVLIAGQPNAVRDIPLLSLKKVLVMDFLIYPYDRYYYPIFKDRLIDMELLNCAPSMEKIRQAQLKHGFDYLVFNYDRNESISDFSRWPEPIKSMLTARMPSPSICAQDLPQELIELADIRVGKSYVLNVKTLLEDGPK